MMKVVYRIFSHTLLVGIEEGKKSITVVLGGIYT